MRPTPLCQQKCDAIDIDNIGCLEPYLPLQDHFEIRRSLGLLCKLDLTLRLMLIKEISGGLGACRPSVQQNICFREFRFQLKRGYRERQVPKLQSNQNLKTKGIIDAPKTLFHSREKIQAKGKESVGYSWFKSESYSCALSYIAVAKCVTRKFGRQNLENVLFDCGQLVR